MIYDLSFNFQKSISVVLSLYLKIARHTENSYVTKIQSPQFGHDKVLVRSSAKFDSDNNIGSMHH